MNREEISGKNYIHYKLTRVILKNRKQLSEIIITRLRNLLAQHQKQLNFINKSRRFRAIWRHDESYETYSHLSG